MHIFTLVFLVVVLAALITQQYLINRQAKSVTAHRDSVPEAFRGKISLEEHQQAADYSIAKGNLGKIDLIVGTGLLFIWTFGGGLNVLDQFWMAFEIPQLFQGVLVMLSFLLISSLLSLPLQIYETFVLEEQFGFNHTKVSTFVSDLLKMTLLTLILYTPLLLLILWLMQSAGQLWWIWAWLTICGFSLLMLWAYPTFIAPIFNEFKSLENEALQQRIHNLLKKCGFSNNGVFVMDGSRRSGHGNAYFTGLGNKKRIVFFDTLLESLTPEEIEAVLAHELGHYKHRHVQKSMVLTFSLTFAALALLSWLMQQPWFYLGLGVGAASIHMALLLFMLVAPSFGFFIKPILSYWQRRHEFEADAFAIEHTDKQPLSHALVKLYKENAATLTPDTLYSSVYDSHPPAPVRIHHIESYEPL